MTDWKFAVAKCDNCGASLARKTPEDVLLATTPVIGEPDAPEVYAAPCPQCQRYNRVVEKGKAPTAEEAAPAEEPSEPAEEPTEPGEEATEPGEPAEPAEEP